MNAKIKDCLKFFLIAGALLIPLAPRQALADAYCSGTLSTLIAYDNGVVQVKHSGSNSTSWVSMSTGATGDTAQRMYAMLTAAYLAGKTVEVKYSGSHTCGSITEYTQFVYVRIL
jgi:hypothetical protein